MNPALYQLSYSANKPCKLAKCGRLTSLGRRLPMNGMVHFFKFRQDLLDPAPAKDVYHKLAPGKGWPEECPPIRAANAFGFDVLANFDITFVRSTKGWRVEPDVVIESDFNWSADDESDGAPLTQQYAWFWEKGQKLPHVISDNVYEAIKNQVKVSSFLYLATDPNELLLMSPIPNLNRPWRVVSAVIDTDWYPASYPWHTVLDLDPGEKRIEIKRGEPLCRIVPVRRDTYFARQMDAESFNKFFERGQRWLEAHGRAHESADGKSHLDITHTYSKQQMKSRFAVME